MRYYFGCEGLKLDMDRIAQKCASIGYTKADAKNTYGYLLVRNVMIENKVNDFSAFTIDLLLKGI